MALNLQAMLVSSSPSGLASNIFKGMTLPPCSSIHGHNGTKARWSMHGIQGKGVKMEMKSLKADGKRCSSEWRCSCNSQKLSAIVNGRNPTEWPVIHEKALESAQNLASYEPANTLGPHEADHSDGLWAAAMKKFDAFYRFSRPYSLTGIVVSGVSVALLTVERSADLSLLFFVGLLKTLLALAFTTVYTSTVNEVFDVEIDKINKPTLPLASGELSMTEGISMTAACGIMGIFMGLKSGSPALLGAILSLFFLGSAYSVNLPLLRWKETPILTLIFTVGSLGVVPHIPFFIHIQKYVLGKPVVLSKSIIFATAFMSLFSCAVSILKDVPDLEGDKRAGIQNLCVRLGAERVFWLGTKTLLVGYGLAMLVGATSANLYSSIITVLGHGILASILWLRARSIDIQDPTSTQSFYMFIWQLFTAEYLLLPFVR